MAIRATLRQPETTHFAKVLEQEAGNVLFSGKGDGERDGRHYLFAGFDCFLASIVKAIKADGLRPENVADLFITHAFGALRDPKNPDSFKPSAEKYCGWLYAFMPTSMIQKQPANRLPCRSSIYAATYTGRTHPSTPIPCLSHQPRKSAPAMSAGITGPVFSCLAGSRIMNDPR
jgi:hypothetical protein